jgi:hypothetical protein
MRQRNIYKRAEDFKGERTSANNAHFGQPQAVACIGAKEQNNQHIRDNRIISTKEIAYETKNVKMASEF